MKVPGFFNNKIVKYVFLALAVLNVVGYLSTGSYECFLVFAVAYALTDNYCKNQSCSILGALFAANFVWGCGRVKESFVEAMKDSDGHSKDAAESATKAALEAMKEAAPEEVVQEKMAVAEMTEKQCNEAKKTWKDGTCSE
tara:strand:- start:85 stop:507 length:423 start_codon:yes stop_codon:yes gene_type:complete